MYLFLFIYPEGWLSPFTLKTCFLLRKISCNEFFNNFFSSISWRLFVIPCFLVALLLSSNYSSPNTILYFIELRSYYVIQYALSAVGSSKGDMWTKRSQLVPGNFKHSTRKESKAVFISRSWILVCKTQCLHLSQCRETHDEAWVIPIPTLLSVSPSLFTSIFTFIYIKSIPIWNIDWYLYL